MVRNIVVIFLVLTYNIKWTKMDDSYRFNVSIVDSCPSTLQSRDVAAASLKCPMDQNNNPTYFCVPNQKKTNLLEFCYDEFLGLVQKGYCLHLSTSGYLNQEECSSFVEGCPDKPFLSNDIYQYPKCQEIDIRNRCFLAAPDCAKSISSVISTAPFERSTPNSSSLSYNVLSSSSTSHSPPTVGDYHNMSGGLIAVIVVVMVAAIIVPVGIYFFWKRWRRSGRHKMESCPEESGILLHDSEGPIPSPQSKAHWPHQHKQHSEVEVEQPECEEEYIPDTESYYSEDEHVQEGSAFSDTGDLVEQSECEEESISDLGNYDSEVLPNQDELVQKGLGFSDTGQLAKQPELEEEYNSNMEKYDFEALAETDFLPRYQYHRFLLDWFIKGLQEIPGLPQPKFKECPIIVGGEISDENLSTLLGENTERSKVSLRRIQKDALARADILVVYFLNNATERVRRDFMNFLGYSPVEKITILFVVQDGGIIDENHKSTLRESLSSIRLILKCEFVAKQHLEIITQMTCMLEKRLFGVLEQAQKNLYEQPLTENVDTSLLEIKAILKRLKQAECYPNLLPEEVEDFPKRRIIDILESFEDRILWHGFDGDTLHIITTDISFQEMLEKTLSKQEFEHMKYSITVEDELSVKLLTKPGEPLHGAKFVYVNNGRDAFLRDEKFATTGSLMLANDSLMVVVTSRHAFSNQENIFVLVERSVLRLGQTVITSQHTKERLCEDITLVKLEPEAVSIVNEQCEKLLIDATGVPTPGRISPRELRVGDIVHKRGAKTGLTTGIVKSILFSKLGGYPEASPIIQICGRGLQPFAGEGDSGSLIFQHSLSPDENSLDVLAMVQSKLNVPIPNAPIVCFPLKEGCETLHRSVSGLQSLQFFNV